MRRFLSLFIVAVLLIIGIIWIVRRPSDNDVRTPEDAVAAIDFAKSEATAHFTVEGPVTAPENHYKIHISVNRSERKMEVIRGYNGEILRTKTYPNTDASFESFLYALGSAGYTVTRDVQLEDERGVCPTGRRFIYEIMVGSEQKHRSWSASCSSKVGTFSGDRRMVNRLFEDQIPDYNELDNGAKL